MHGLVHHALRSFVRETAGAAVWAAALREAGVTEESAILDAEQYPDAATFAVVSAVAAALRLELGAALDAFGEYFVSWLAEMGQMRMIDAMGATLDDLLRNLNSLHHALARTHRDAQFPTFKVEGCAADGTLVISYASVRGELLAPLVVGILRAVSLLKVDAPLEMRRLDAPHAGYDVTWACALGAPRAAPAERSAAPVRMEHERRMARGWHRALVESCCGGGQRAPRAQPAPGIIAGWWTRHARVAVAPDTAARSAGAHSGSPAGRSPLSAWSVSRSPNARWVPLGKLSIGARSSAASHETDADSRRGDGPDDLVRDIHLRQLDRLLSALPSLADPGAALMRAVPCGRVAASLDDAAKLRRASTFWRTNVGSIDDYELSAPAEFAARFVSHTWQQPTDWHALMGAKCDFAEVKAAVLSTAARDLVWQRRRHIDLARRKSITSPTTVLSAALDAANGARGDGPPTAADGARLTQRAAPIERWQDATLWVDKCCVAQQHPIMVPTIALLEQFVRRCEGMIVLFTWDFFARLWCVYEWALFLVLHDAEHVQLCVDFFLNERTLPRYVEAIRAFRFADARTFYESDIELVRQRVEAMYHSIEHFERFVQLAAIVHVAVAVAKRTGLTHDPTSAESDLLVWAHLAAELGLAQLADVLSRARPAAWLKHAEPAGRDDAFRSGGIAGDRTWRAHLSTRVDSWFRRELRPLLALSRSRSVRPAFLNAKSPSPYGSKDWSVHARRVYTARVANGALAGAHPSVIARNRAQSTELSDAVDEGIRRSQRPSEESAARRSASLDTPTKACAHEGQWGPSAMFAALGTSGGSSGAQSRGGGRGKRGGSTSSFFSPSAGASERASHGASSMSASSRGHRGSADASWAGPAPKLATGAPAGTPDVAVASWVRFAPPVATEWWAPGAVLSPERSPLARGLVSVERMSSDGSTLVAPSIAPPHPSPIVAMQPSPIAAFGADPPADPADERGEHLHTRAGALAAFNRLPIATPPGKRVDPPRFRSADWVSSAGVLPAVPEGQSRASHAPSNTSAMPFADASEEGYFSPSRRSAAVPSSSPSTTSPLPDVRLSTL
ncbi:hypothetical protein KFE25_004404 [Diacronema lutheri]|uniref:Heme NO-binding domain-containing protein n=1 Tax=Diacronema lutheri TaxID=2081491 RepID=A0A8J5XAV1_DIALT|nr:hypothetical protein KFE25_004404 [Diacronema lutheri]